MKTIIKYVKPYFGRMIYGFVIKFIGTIMDLFIPYILAYMIDDVIPLKNVSFIIVWGVIMVLFSLFGVTTNILANRLASGVARDFTRDLRHDLYKKTTELSSRQLDDLTIPSLVARLTTDTYNLHQMVGMCQRLGVRAPILILGGVIVTATLEPVLCLVLLGTLPFIGLVVYFVSKKGIPMFSVLQKRIDILVKIVRENITGVRVIKALSKENYEVNRFDNINKNVIISDKIANKTMALINPLMNILLNIGLVLIIIIGAYRVNLGVSEPGKIVAFLSYFTIILTAMMNITRLFIIFSKASASASRIEEVLLTTNQITIVDSPTVNNETYIEFKDVTFAYNEEETLTNINFNIKKNQSLGIIGATGAGKSTIIQLLMRFYDVNDGSILINGKDVRSYSDKNLKEKFGVTFQNDTIFANTVYENIRFGRSISDEDIIQATKDAMAYDFIENLENKFDTHIEAKGVNLSGGQKQRLLIARALAGKPEILILDDASSALDYKTDSLVRKSITANYNNTTLIMIAQRISSIMALDHILVIDDGKIVDQGDHQYLLDNCDIYKDLATSQMGGQINEI